jgi:hypothetical protein
MTFARPAPPALAAALAAALAGCSSGDSTGPWLTMPDAAAHAASFPIAAGQPHAGLACDDCHREQVAGAWQPSASFASYTCVGCHSTARPDLSHDARATIDALHALVTGYAYDDPPSRSRASPSRCLGCHPDGSGGAPANHPLLFPIGAGSRHAGVSCGQCHTDAADRPNTAKLACATCHQALSGFATAHAVAGYAITTTVSSPTAAPVPVPLDSPGCLRCHADSQVDRVAAHPATDESFLRIPHRDAGCLTCHSGSRADKPYAAADYRATPGCFTCHPTGTGGGL